MAVKKETIEKDKERIMDCLRQQEVLRLKELMSGELIFIGNEKTGKVNNYRISRAVKELREEGKIVARYLTDDLELSLVDGFIPKLANKAKIEFTGFYETLKSKLTREEFVEEKSAEVYREFPPASVSAYLAAGTLNRSKATKRRPTGWNIYYGKIKEFEKVTAKKTFDKGNASLELIISNFPTKDTATLRATFRRKPKEVMRVQVNQINYARKVFEDILPNIYERTRTLDFFANYFVWKCAGDLDEIVRRIETIRLITEEKDSNKKLEFIEYFMRRVSFHLKEYLVQKEGSRYALIKI